MKDPAHDHENFVDAIMADADVEDAVLVSYALVCEWVDAEGKRWLTRIDADASGKRLAAWQRQGMLFNALHTPWNDDPDEGETE